MSDPELLTSKEACALLRINATTLQRMVHSGQLTPRRFGPSGRIWRFLKRELLAPPPSPEPEQPMPIVRMPVALPVADPDPYQGRRLTRVKGGGLRYR